MKFCQVGDTIYSIVNRFVDSPRWCSIGASGSGNAQLVVGSPNFPEVLSDRSPSKQSNKEGMKMFAPERWWFDILRGAISSARGNSISHVTALQLHRLSLALSFK